jgi:hypothetical protein
MSRKISFVIVVLLALTVTAGVQPAHATSNPNPAVVPNVDGTYGNLGGMWWQWALSFPKAQVPYLQNGPVNISSGQRLPRTWFLAGEGWGMGPVVRSGVVPTGTYLFVSLANYINDYPCPDPSFHPDPGETLVQFLTRTGQVPPLSDLFAVIDGVPVTGFDSYKATSGLFWFRADPAMVEFDPCVTGKLQPAVTDGYWLLLWPLRPGPHTLHFGTPSWGQDVTYNLTVR